MKTSVNLCVQKITLIFFISSFVTHHSSLSQTTYKIGITQTGVYKIDAGFFKKMGVNIANINPKNLKLFGNGGAMLPQANAVARPNDLTENAVFVKGEEDGRFDEADALWFFGQSPHVIAYDSLNKQLSHQINHYCDTTFYFLQLSTSAGLRLKNQGAGQNGYPINSFDDYVFHETELYNAIFSGREWWGEYFTFQNTQDFTFDVKGLIINSPARVKAATVAAAQVATKFSVNLNGQALGSQSHDVVSTYRYDYKGRRTVQNYTASLPTNANLKVSLTFDKNGQANASGYLDFVGVQCHRALQFYEQPTIVRSLASVGKDSVRYLVAQASDMLKVWDITNALQPKNQLFTLKNNEASFSASANVLRSFLMFSESQLISPVSFQKVVIQNIRNLQTPQLLIVTANKWRKQAQKLAAFRWQNDGIEALVVSTDEVFNEFASGQPDPTAIRDYARFLNQRQPNRLKYLLLFGDANYDFKNNSLSLKPWQRSDFVPTYESRESAHPVFSFSSDDYFGFLENNEGEWPENFADASTLDIGIGRLPVKTIDEAETVVNKIMRYANKRTMGKWRQRIAFVADDGDGNLHQSDADFLATMLNRSSPAFYTQKIFVDAYNQTVNANFQRAADVNKAIDKAVNEGSLILNYTGHGGESIWAEEQILTLENLLKWRGLDNMPLIITATCEFGRYENPAVVSGAELATLNPRGGAIAMLTTARPVYANTNYLLNEAFYKNAFVSINGQMPRLGDAMRLTKNNSLSGVLNRNFTLLGDPSLMLNVPKNEVIISTNDTLKAGKLVKISGEIQQNQKRLTSFDGIALVTVYDKENQIVTKGTESTPMSFGQFANKIFEGQVSVKQGQFSAQFVVPKNIDTKLGTGRVQIYAINADSLADAAGANNKIWIGGKDGSIIDNKPPIIQVFMNNETFVDGDQIAPNSTFFAKISDENGLDLSSKSMMLTLNDTLTYDVSDYFLADSDNYQKGTISFPFENLPEGAYKLHLKIRDTHNNAAETSLKFNVALPKQVVRSLVVYPNPLVENTKFRIEPLDNEVDITTELNIFDANGKVVRQQSVANYGIYRAIDFFEWDGTNQRNELLPRGTYYYKLKISSLANKHTQFLTGKILLLK